MDLIVDANIVIAALISPAGLTANLIFSNMLTIYAPEFLLQEIEEHKEEIMTKTGLTPEDIETELMVLTTRIMFFSLAEITNVLPQAEKISPDPDDVAYFAVALLQGCPIWSNDKPIRGQHQVPVYSTTELVAFLSRG